MTIPNQITICRILLIPVFVLLAVYYGQSVQEGTPHGWLRWWAVAVFTIAAASDGIDGYIARRYNQRSRLGVILDPIADKGLLLAGVLTLTFSRWSYELPLWFPIVVVTRDAVVVIGALVLHLLNGTVTVRPSVLGKCATALQMAAVVAVLLGTDAWQHTISLNERPITLHFPDLPVALAGLFTIVSGIGYMFTGITQLHVGGHGDPAAHDQTQTSLETGANPDGPRAI